MRHFAQFLLAVLLIFPQAGPGQQVDLKRECLKTLYVLCPALLDLQITDADNADVGAIQCPEHHVLHTRAAEAVFPFAVAYKHSGDEKYLRAAIRVGNWLIRQQLAEGEWKETPWEWTGTTADQLLMMAAAFPIVSEHLSAAEKNVWMGAIRKAAVYLVKYMSPDFASINYCPTTAAALAMTYQIIPEERFKKKAKELARWTIAKMDEDGFIHGEAARVLGVKYGVDVGYQLDMSLWGLALYARWFHDELVMQHVRKSLKNMLAFIYPNGMIDGAWGARCYKWTTYGSKTADGCQILFSLFAPEDAVYRTAAIRNLRYLRTMIRDGLVGNGPHFWHLPLGAPCNYPTFARAKNLALAVEYGEQQAGSAVELPADRIGWTQYFPTVNVAVVRSKNFMSTISAYNYRDALDWGKGKYTHRPAGGAMVNLWVQDFGLLQTSSQVQYVRGEEIHMPVIEDSIISLTPRIEFRSENGYFTNLYDRQARMTIGRDEGVTAVIATAGELCNEQHLPGGVAYDLTHIIAGNFVEKKVRLRYHDRHPQIRIVEPFVQAPGLRFEQVGARTVRIRGGKREFLFELIEGQATLESGREAGRYWYPFPAIKCYPVVLHIEPPQEDFIREIKYRISVR